MEARVGFCVSQTSSAGLARRSPKVSRNVSHAAG